MKKIFFTCLLVPILTFSQNQTLYLKNGETMSVEKIRYRNPIFGKERLVVGEKTYYMNQIDSFTIFNITYLSKQLRGNGMLEHYDHPMNFYRHRKLVQIIQNDEQALSAFRPARKIYTIQTIIRGTALGLFVAALSVNPAYFATTGEGLMYSALTLSMASDIHGIFSSEKYFASLYEAVRIQNQ